MEWRQYTVAAENIDGRHPAKQTRAVSVAHALTLCMRLYPEAQGYRMHEAELCRCRDINNDMCTACYLFWGLQ